MAYACEARVEASKWLAGELQRYTETFSLDGGSTVPHVRCVGNLRHYTTTRFFSRWRVERRREPTTEAFIEKKFAAEPQDDALNMLQEIYRVLKEKVPEPTADDEFL